MGCSSLARDHDDRLAFAGQLGDQRVDFGLGTYVDTAGRLVYDQDVRIGQQPAAYQNLLLIAAGKVLDGSVDRRCFGIVN